jgi:hypothetical protein
MFIVTVIADASAAAAAAADASSVCGERSAFFRREDEWGKGSGRQQCALFPSTRRFLLLILFLGFPHPREHHPSNHKRELNEKTQKGKEDEDVLSHDFAPAKPVLCDEDFEEPRMDMMGLLRDCGQPGVM